MTESRHTPGPWQYRPNKRDDWGFVRALPEAGETLGHLVAIAKDTSIPFSDYDAYRARKADPFEANARLIAAAPALLATLERIEDYLNGAIGGGTIDLLPPANYTKSESLNSLMLAIRDMAAEAVATAEGRLLTLLPRQSILDLCKEDR